MNSIFFGLKRAYLGTQRGIREPLRKMGLTPARHDMLATLRKFALQVPPLRQREVRTSLGVSGPTVSRMLKALEKLGLVRREKDPEDRRHRLVRITPSGNAALDRARDDAHWPKETDIDEEDDDEIDDGESNERDETQAEDCGRAELDRLENAYCGQRDGPWLQTPAARIDGADGAWYFFFLSRTLRSYEKLTASMLKRYPRSFGPYPAWHPAD
jgi:DNA-binding MarR family transcriptional regulator